LAQRRWPLAERDHQPRRRLKFVRHAVI